MRIVSIALVVFLLPVALDAQDRQVLHGPGEVSGLPFSMAVRISTMSES